MVMCSPPTLKNDTKALQWTLFDMHLHTYKISLARSDLYYGPQIKQRQYKANLLKMQHPAEYALYTCEHMQYHYSRQWSPRATHPNRQ